ncbi:hypothetical protein ACHAWF_004622 [Thalassiosira exigua]
MKKFCNVTFVEEGQPGPDGTPWKLLRCSRCLGCFYRGKEEQKRHWKVHKKVCRPPSPISPLADKQRYDDMGMNEAGAELMMLFNHRAFDAGPVWAMLMERVRRLFLANEDRSRMWQIGVRGNLPSWAVQVLPALSNEVMELLWATPGMASFLLSSVDLTSERMRQKREGGTPLLAEELHCYGSCRSDPAVHTNFGFASFVCVWTMASSQRKTDGGWQYRNTEFARAATRRLALWWKDPYTRASMSLLRDHHTSNRQEWMPLAVMTAVDQSPIDDANPAEIAPGLTAKDAAMTIAMECYVYSPMRLEEMVHCLVDSCGDKREAWRRFGAEDRAECALVAVERMLVKESPEAREGWCFRSSLSLGVELVSALTGMTGKVKDPGLRLEVLRLASRNRSKRGTVRPGRLHPPDYFGICLDKIIEAHRPQLNALADAIKPLDVRFPPELLHLIAEFICDPFRKESRDGVEMTYLVGFVEAC